MTTALGAGIGACVGAAAAALGRQRGAARRAATDQVSRAARAQQALSERVRAAVDHLESAIVVVDAGGNVEYRNESARRYDGTHAGLLIDGHIATSATAAQAAVDATAVRHVVDLHGPPRQWFEFRAYRLPDGGAVVTVRDVSDRARTDAVRTDFVTNVSHELKTPVGALAVLAEALIDEDDPDVIDRLAGRLVNEAHRTANTIADLLELSQIESTSPTETDVDLGAIVERAVERGRAADYGRGVHIDATIDAAPLVVRGDAQQLESAVGNLVENAVKYSHDGGAVDVGAHVGAEGIEVTVADHGIGIPERDLDRVFERFYRVDRARSRGTGGTGLGLAIVRHVAANHGGEVLVSSHEGEGSTFVLRLPPQRLVSTASEAQR